MKRLSAAQGFTLIELLVTMTIAAILLAIAVPMYNSAIASNRATEAANSLASMLELARSEASGGTALSVAVCRAIDNPPTACSNAADGDYAAADFASGLIVFLNRNTGGTDTALDSTVTTGSGATPDQIVSVLPPSGGATRVRIQQLGPDSTTAPTGVIVLRPGSLSAPVSPAPVVFRVGFPQTASTVLSCREVVLSAAGSPTVTRRDPASCWPT
jgi:prepilin-type N-terminal cleavage/methylation domain-containing protein